MADSRPAASAVHLRRLEWLDWQGLQAREQDEHDERCPLPSINNYHRKHRRGALRREALPLAQKVGEIPADRTEVSIEHGSPHET